MLALASGVAKSHREVTFYHFHNTYYTTLLTYPREIKIVKIPPRTTSRDRSSRRDSHPPSLTLKSAGRPNFSPKSAQMRRTRAARAARADRWRASTVRDRREKAFAHRARFFLQVHRSTTRRRAAAKSAEIAPSAASLSAAPRRRRRGLMRVLARFRALFAQETPSFVDAARVAPPCRRQKDRASDPATTPRRRRPRARRRVGAVGRRGVLGVPPKSTRRAR